LVGRQRGLRAILLGRRGRFAIATTPVVVAFLAAEWMVLTGSGSFTGVLNFIGILVVALPAGVFPALLLVSSRRKGEHVPAGGVRRLGNPVLLSGIYFLFVAGVLLHGLVIWDNPFKRGAALLAGAVMVAMTLIMAAAGPSPRGRTSSCGTAMAQERRRSPSRRPDGRRKPTYCSSTPTGNSALEPREPRSRPSPRCGARRFVRGDRPGSSPPPGN
jgi:hypothetical protein